MVQLDGLVQQGHVNSAQPTAERLFQDAVANGSRAFARRVEVFRNTHPAPELKLALQQLALQRACYPWSDLTHDTDGALLMTYWPENCPLNAQLQ